ncbi:hypothetical protein Cgig2_027153 [Carnegiea gigantea]|uniref:Uncharacterized protein n=1 Tax=Carnegiea gigantea TaxID=171969 RepID=A0A9Q1GUX5_9CARY|nr:hypothetical protein Cgig2_027153 [Carnegiea gigantea]
MKEEAIKPQCVDLLQCGKEVQRKRVMAFTPLSAPTERLKAVEIDLEKDRTRTKQSKVNAKWMKTAKKKLVKAFGSWVIDNNQPFTVVDSIYTNLLLDTIREVSRNLDVDGQEEDDIMNIDNDEDRQLDVSPPFRYSVDQQFEGTHNSGSGGDSSPPSTADGSGDGGNGGNRCANDIGTSQSSRPSSRDVNPTMSDHNSRRG